MSQKFNKLVRFWQELKRRRVAHVIVVYATASFVILELINNVFEPLRLPEWTPLMVILVLATGFPLAIIFSWFFDISHGKFEKTLAIQEKEVPTMNDHIQKFSDTSKNSIAVLPFQDLSPNKDQEYFCDGMAEEIINILAQIERLKVIARTSSFAFKNTNKDIRVIGSSLGVNTILEGSIQKSSDKIRISVQLINTADGAHLWSERYDKPIQDLFVIQDEISSSVFKNLKIKLLGSEHKALSKNTTENVEAYLLFLKGNYHRQNSTADELKKAISYYTQALKSDPNFAPALCGIATAFWGLTYWGNLPPNQGYPVIKSRIKQAFEINESLAEIYFLDAVTDFFFEWSLDKAESKFQKALQLNPNSVISLSSYSLFLTCIEKHDEAIKMAKLASELNPLSNYDSAIIATAYVFSGRYDEAIQHCKTSISKHPDHFFFHYFLGFAYHGKSMMNEAIEEYEKSLTLSNRAQLVLANLIIAYVETGNMEKADSLIIELKTLSEQMYVLPSHFYKIYLIKNEPSLAFEWFERAFEEHDSFLPFIRIHPFKNLRIPNNPEYTKLLAGSGLSMKKLFTNKTF